jgi:large subunit ribosomal protein L10
VDFAKTNDRLEIVGGAMGDTMLDVDGVKALAALPSLDELRATIVGLVQAPATKIARTVNEPAASWRASSVPMGPRKPLKRFSIN